MENKKYLDLQGLIHYNEKLKAQLEELFKNHSHTLTIGKYTYDGTEDVSVDVYEGEYKE